MYTGPSYASINASLRVVTAVPPELLDRLTAERVLEYDPGGPCPSVWGKPQRLGKDVRGLGGLPIVRMVFPWIEVWTRCLLRIGFFYRGEGSARGDLTNPLSPVMVLFLAIFFPKKCRKCDLN